MWLKDLDLCFGDKQEDGQMQYFYTQRTNITGMWSSSPLLGAKLYVW